MAEAEPKSRKPRTKRACDVCRAKKRTLAVMHCVVELTVRDGLRAPFKRCSHCAVENGACVFSPDAPKNRPSYLGVLEQRLERNRNYLKTIGSNDELAPFHLPMQQASRLQTQPTSASASTASARRLPGPGVELAALTIRSMNTKAPLPSQEDLGHVDLIEYMDGLPQGTDYKQRLHGKSSTVRILKVAAQLRQEYEERKLPWAACRERYWRHNPLATCPGRVDRFTFPPPDLLAELIDLYFHHKNIYLPVLHRPTFERSVTLGAHLVDDGFAPVVLLVCAIAARYSTDPRVSPPGSESLDCGYEFFRQVPMTTQHIFEKPRLYHLQSYCLAAVFLECSAHSVWSLVGMGIRMAQDVGAHRKIDVNSKSRQPRLTVESELWKRCFWALICLERVVCTGLGRPASTQFEAFDADMPIECDDEYWESENPALAFTQPAGRPSLTAYFTSYILLSNIWGFGLNMLYALKKGKVLLSYRDYAWEQKILSELDYALARWVASIPAHLRWSPNIRDEKFFYQSATLHAYYHTVQVTIHRPFIPTFLKDPGAKLSSDIPSLAICTNAGRSFSHVAQVITQRQNPSPMPSLVSLTFICGLVLVLNVWSGKRTGLPPYMNTTTEEVAKCMKLLLHCEERWQSAGLFWDLLHELVVLSDSVAPLTPTKSFPAESSKKRSYVAKRDHVTDAPGHIVFSPFERNAQNYEPQELTETSNIPSHESTVGNTSTWSTQTSRPGAPEFQVGRTADVEEMKEYPRTSLQDLAQVWADTPMTLEMGDWSAYFNTMTQRVG
ncbi:Zn(2)-C6 fungal-type domain-containing protein [Mycena indigotica]|uniref:Zn(2)-C6 fungal-type domain-containing protein n=1 Tax=Mycena indigotica TaxID=2126181 RepID=A0A8H6SKD4_9AGAR|nr:Zn(2)-C6 fungal-type domain-containing protein [Mycena indigotica]KAF7300949.1 Zn(2)-C6 fungal-type domain-containing protein [Mycena indigotica]